MSRKRQADQMELLVIRTCSDASATFTLSPSITLNKLKQTVACCQTLGAQPIQVKHQRFFHLGRELKTGGRSLEALGVGRFGVYCVHVHSSDYLNTSNSNNSNNNSSKNETEVLEVDEPAPPRRSNPAAAAAAGRTKKRAASVVDLADDSDDDNDNGDEDNADGDDDCVVVEVAALPRKRNRRR